MLTPFGTFTKYNQKTSAKNLTHTFPGFAEPLMAFSNI